MKSWFAFMKKEFTEQMRSGRLAVLGLIFVLLGIMNPAVAKLTPWLLETLSDSLAQNGMIVGEVQVSALDSWVQFYKNVPMGLIAFVLLQSSIFTKEYTTGTLVLSLTKGLKRYKVVVAKAMMLTALWTVGYWLCFGITYAYTAYFWDNAVAQNLVFSVICWWLFGVMVTALMVLFSTVFNANTGVLLGTGGVVLASYLIGLLPQCSRYVPTQLMDGNALIYGLSEAKTYMPSLAVAAAGIVLCFAVSVPIFNKKLL